MEVSNLLIHKESVRNPDLLDIVSTNYKLLNTILEKNTLFDLKKSRQIKAEVGQFLDCKIRHSMQYISLGTRI